MRRLLILLALLGGRCHAFSSMHRGWRPRTFTNIDSPLQQYSKHAIKPLAMTPPVTQAEVNGDSTTKATLDEEGGAVRDVDIGDDLTPVASSVVITPSSTKRQLPSNWLGEKLYILSTAALIGILTGTNIAVFKTAVELVREGLYGDGIILPFVNPSLWDEIKGDDILIYTLRISEILPIWLIPAIGGILVGILLAFGDMPPGLRDTVKEVDLDSLRATNATPPDELLSCVSIPPAPQRNDLGRFSRKALAATVTLGTGNSLGPEGVSSETWLCACMSFDLWHSS
jgi:hypothetical protein